MCQCVTRSIRQSVRLRTDCLSANQIKEFVAYFNQYTITENVQNILDYCKDVLYFIENALEYVEWLLIKKDNRGVQFEWDAPVIEFVESLEYDCQEKTLNLLRGPGHLNEGKGGIKSFDWRN